MWTRTRRRRHAYLVVVLLNALLPYVHPFFFPSLGGLGSLGGGGCGCGPSIGGCGGGCAPPIGGLGCGGGCGGAIGGGLCPPGCGGGFGGGYGQDCYQSGGALPYSNSPGYGSGCANPPGPPVGGNRGYIQAPGLAPAPAAPPGYGQQQYIPSQQQPAYAQVQQPPPQIQFPQQSYQPPPAPEPPINYASNPSPSIDQGFKDNNYDRKSSLRYPDISPQLVPPPANPPPPPPPDPPRPLSPNPPAQQPQSYTSYSSSSFTNPPTRTTDYNNYANDNVETKKDANDITSVETFGDKPSGDDFYEEKVPDVDDSEAPGNSSGDKKKNDLLTADYSENSFKSKVAGVPSDANAEDRDSTGDPKCSSETLRLIMHENIVSSPTISKQLIFSAGRLAFGQTIDVICSRNKFSYTVVSSKIFCEASRGRITCFAFLQP